MERYNSVPSTQARPEAIEIVRTAYGTCKVLGGVPRQALAEDCSQQVIEIIAGYLRHHPEAAAAVWAKQCNRQDVRQRVAPTA